MMVHQGNRHSGVRTVRFSGANQLCRVVAAATRLLGASKVGLDGWAWRRPWAPKPDAVLPKCSGRRSPARANPTGQAACILGSRQVEIGMSASAAYRTREPVSGSRPRQRPQHVPVPLALRDQGRPGRTAPSAIRAAPGRRPEILSRVARHALPWLAVSCAAPEAQPPSPWAAVLAAEDEGGREVGWLAGRDATAPDGAVLDEPLATARARSFVARLLPGSGRDVRVRLERSGFVCYGTGPYACAYTRSEPSSCEWVTRVTVAVMLLPPAASDAPITERNVEVRATARRRPRPNDCQSL